MLEIPRLIVLGDFNIHAENSLQGLAQDFVASLIALGLFQFGTVCEKVTL